MQLLSCANIVSEVEFKFNVTKSLLSDQSVIVNRNFSNISTLLLISEVSWF